MCTKNIKNIIFDLGGVLVNWSPLDCVYSIFGENERSNKLANIIFNSHIWKAMDRGDIDENIGKMQILKKYPEFKDEIEELFKSYKKCLKPLTSNIEVAKSLKNSGYELFILSNIFDEVWKYILSTSDFFNFFDGIVLSYIEKTSKPDEKMYQKIINRYELIPSQTLYIDDSAENIKMGRKMGLHSLHLPSNSQLHPLILEKFPHILD